MGGEAGSRPGREVGGRGDIHRCNLSFRMGWIWSREECFRIFAVQWRRERHTALQLESLCLYYFPFLASGGVSELRASPDCHWPESVHVWDQCLLPSVLQQTGEGCAASGRQRGTPRASLTQAHSLGMGLSVQHKNQNEKDAQLDLNFWYKTDSMLVSVCPRQDLGHPYTKKLFAVHQNSTSPWRALTLGTPSPP